MSSRKPKFFSSLLLGTQDLDQGERKLGFSIYILHRLWLAVILEILMYIALRNFNSYEHKDLIELFKVINEFFLWGSAGALGIYSGANVMGRKYGEAGGYGGGYGGYGQEGPIQHGGVNINVSKPPEEGENPTDTPTNAPAPKGLPPLPVKPKPSRAPGRGLNIK